MSSNPPAFQFYARDWLSGKRCRMLRPVERAAYMDLLAVAWLDGRIPVDEEDLGDLLRGLGNNPADLRLGKLLELFPDGKNDRQEKERAKQAAYRKKKAEAGRKGGLAKAKRERSSAKAQPEHSHSNTKAEGLAKPSLASASASSNGSSVVSQPAEADVDNSLENGLRWNDRLAPLAREAGGESRVADWLRTAKPKPDYYEEVLIGLVSMRERGAIDFLVKPGEPMSPAILSISQEGQPIERRAIAEYKRLGRVPKRNGSMERLTVGGPGHVVRPRSGAETR